MSKKKNSPRTLEHIFTGRVARLVSGGQLIERTDLLILFRHHPHPLSPSQRHHFGSGSLRLSPSGGRGEVERFGDVVDTVRFVDSSWMMVVVVVIVVGVVVVVIVIIIHGVGSIRGVRGQVQRSRWRDRCVEAAKQKEKQSISNWGGMKDKR